MELAGRRSGSGTCRSSSRGSCSAQGASRAAVGWPGQAGPVLQALRAWQQPRRLLGTHHEHVAQAAAGAGAAGPPQLGLHLAAALHAAHQPRVSHLYSVPPWTLQEGGEVGGRAARGVAGEAQARRSTPRWSKPHRRQCIDTVLLCPATPMRTHPGFQRRHPGCLPQADLLVFLTVEDEVGVIQTHILQRRAIGKTFVKRKAVSDSGKQAGAPSCTCWERSGQPWITFKATQCSAQGLPAASMWHSFLPSQLGCRGGGGPHPATAAQLWRCQSVVSSRSALSARAVNKSRPDLLQRLRSSGNKS